MKPMTGNSAQPIWPNSAVASQSTARAMASETTQDIQIRLGRDGTFGS